MLNLRTITIVAEYGAVVILATGADGEANQVAADFMPGGGLLDPRLIGGAARLGAHGAEGARSV